jgi:hypothetical protein
MEADMSQRAVRWSGKRPTLSDEEFILAWNRSESIAEVVERLAETSRQRGLAAVTASYVNYKGFQLRRSGAALKQFRKGRPLSSAKKVIGDERFARIWNESNTIDEVVTQLALIATENGIDSPSRAEVDGWVRGLRQDGVKLRRMPPPRRACKPGSTRVRVLELFAQGMIASDIALKVGVSKQRVSQILAESGFAGRATPIREGAA